MIGFLRGTVFSLERGSLLLDVCGVGYRVIFSNFEKIHIGEEIFIYTYQHVREDDISLFGFLEKEDYNLFLQLITVKGIGPKTACSILASASSLAILTAIENGDAAFMKKLPGIGAKAASQIILDLKGKLIDVDNNKAKSAQNNRELEEAISALKSLGYKAGEIENILPKLTQQESSTQDYLRLALSLLAR